MRKNCWRDKAKGSNRSLNRNMHQRIIKKMISHYWYSKSYQIRHNIIQKSIAVIDMQA
jgi:hypothetical protein